MPDEIDLLRLFRADTPEPDEAAWEKARSAVTAVRGTAVEEPVVVAGRRRDHWWRRPQHRVGVISGAALAAGIAAGIVSGLLQGPPTLSGPLVTGWQAGRALAPAATSLQVSPGGWRLLSHLVPQGWQYCFTRSYSG